MPEGAFGSMALAPHAKFREAVQDDIAVAMSSIPDSKRQFVVHHDDLGGSHSANIAFRELFDLGVVTSGSVMVPCPWFAEIARMARERPDFDLGVHLTLTSEFPDCRWGPVTGVGGGMTEADGCFPWTVTAARRADPAAVEVELRAQMDMALDCGIDATHIDAHMGAAWQPEFLDIYVRLGEDYNLPVVLPRNAGELAPPDTDFSAAFATLTARRNPDFASILITPFEKPTPTAEDYAELFAEAGPGLTYGAFHFTTPADFAFVSTDAPIRTAEYELFRSGRAAQMMDDAELERVGMRAFRDAMRV